MIIYEIIRNGDMMKKYLIGLDLDGTLLDDDVKIPIKTKQYLQKLKKHGHKIVILTGRPYRGCKEYYDELKLDTPLVCDNGSAIYGCREKDFNSVLLTIDKPIVDALFQFSKDHIVTAFYSVGDLLVTYKPQERLSFLYHRNEFTKMVEKPFDDPSLPVPYGIMIAIKVTFDEVFEDYIENHTDGLLTYRCWGKDKNNAFYEIYQRRASKGDALLHIASFYGLEKEQLIAFGDGLNDKEMLDVAHVGIKMINGVDALDDVADYITEYTNHEEGVMKFLKTFFKLNL